MSLIRQIWLLLLAVVLVGILGGAGVSLVSTRNTLQTQLSIKNSDNAGSLALVLSQQKGDRELMELAMSAQFDTGFYRSLRFTPADGAPAYTREVAVQPERAPRWFVGLLSVASQPGVAQVSDGWRPLGRLELVSHVAYAYDELWLGARRATLWMILIGLGGAALAWFAVRRIRRPLDATIAQARALEEGRYVIVDEPRVPELRSLAMAMNAMVGRVRSLFEAHASQTDQLRRQAYCDPLTGLPHREHFIAQMRALLEREDGADGGGLVIVRVADLGGLNLTAGRECADGALQAIADLLQAYPDRVPDCLIGRLNGSDFGLCMPTPGIAAETAVAIANALRASLPAFGVTATVHLGAVEIRARSGVGNVLARADVALARAEQREPFAVEVVDLPPSEQDDVGEQGQRAWREQLLSALQGQRARLYEFPVIDRAGTVVHLECPLRLQLSDDGEYLAAARWLPLALRSQVTAAADAQAIVLALDAIARDGIPRGVNVAAASLAEGGFGVHLYRLLSQRPKQASKLWLEVGEGVPLERFEALQEFGQLVRPLGVQFGLEHAGQRLNQIERLFELGLDYVKLDAAFCAGVATQAASREFVRSTTGLLHALSIRVIAEGVSDGADAEVLWTCGLDAITGPWASAKR